MENQIKRNRQLPMSRGGDSFISGVSCLRPCGGNALKAFDQLCAAVVDIPSLTLRVCRLTCRKTPQEQR